MRIGPFKPLKFHCVTSHFFNIYINCAYITISKYHISL